MSKHGLHLPRMAWWLLVVSGFFHLSISLSNTFVNIFVFKVDHSFAAIAWYNLPIFVLLPFTFVLAAWIAQHTSTAMALRIGIALHALFYAVTLVIGERAARMPWALGVLMGLAAGFYWLAFDVLSVEYTDQDGHEPFFGTHGVLTSVANVIAPPIAGWLISREDVFLGGLSGYHIVFGISFVLFIGATFFSFRLHSDPMSHLHLRRGLQALRKASWMRLMAASSIYGLREGVFMFLIGLLVYVATGSEMKLGVFLLLQGGLSFLAFFLAGRLSAKYRSRLIGIGSIGMSIAAILFLFPIHARTIIMYGCLTAAALPFFMVPLQGYVYDGIDGRTDEDTPATTHIIVREWFENLGRIIGIILFLTICVHQTPNHLGKLRGLSFALGLVQLGSWAILIPTIRKQRPKRPKRRDREELAEGERKTANKRLNPMS